MSDALYSRRAGLATAAFCFLLSFGSCSSIDTAYYARPEEKFLAAERCPAWGFEAGTIPCARLKIDGIEIVYWANTNYHPTMTGPCLFPVFPEEAPILASYDVHLNWRVLIPQNLKTDPASVLVLQSSLLATVDGARVDKPTNLTRYRFHGHDQIEEHLSFSADYERMPDSIALKGDTTFELWYNTIVYQEVRSFSVQPSFVINGKTVQGPRITFTPDKDRKYVPYIFPFMFAPVR